MSSKAKEKRFFFEKKIYTKFSNNLSGEYKDNYSLANYSEAQKSKTWTIEQKVVTFGWNYNAAEPLQYNALPQAVEAEVIGAITGDDVAVISPDGYENNTKINVGIYQAKVKTLTNVNYTFNTADAGSNWCLDWQIIPMKVS